MFYIYILYSVSSDIYYVGHSDDPWNRVIQHNTKERGTFSSKHQPWELAAIFEAGRIRSEALIIEQFIKKQKSRKLIEKLIDPQFLPEGNIVQLVRVPHVRD